MSRPMNRRELAVLIQQLTVASVTLPACKPGGDSDFKDLSNQTGETATTQERINDVVQRYQMSSWVQGGDRQADVFKQLSVVPDVYLEFLLKRHREVGFDIQFGGEAGGMCWFDGVGATKITLNNVHHATIHEVGHGVETKAHQMQNINNISAEREAAYGMIMSSSEAGSIRAYAQSNSKELWADGFSSFYRSPESRNIVRNQMPQTWNWLKGVLIKPVNLGPGEDPNEFIPGPGGTPPPATPPANTTATDTGTPATPPATQPATPPATQPATTTPAVNTQVAVNPVCQNPANAKVAALCALSQMIQAGGLGLTALNNLILPRVGQVLSAFDEFMVLAQISLSDDEARDVVVSIDNIPVATGLTKILTPSGQPMYNAMFKVPVKLTKVAAFSDHTLRIRLDGQEMFTRPIKLTRFTMCGDVRDLRG